MHLRNVTLTIPVLATVAFSQITPLTIAPEDGPYQVRYAANLKIGESYINIINDGYSGASALGPGFPIASTNICVNVYAISPDEQLQACCSCMITPDGVVNLGVNADVLSNTATPGGKFLSSIVLKLVGSQPVGGQCTNSAALVTQSNMVGGYIAYGTTLHVTPNGTYTATETKFASANASMGELASLAYRCYFILGNLSGNGSCGQCHSGAQ